MSSLNYRAAGQSALNSQYIYAEWMASLFTQTWVPTSFPCLEHHSWWYGAQNVQGTGEIKIKKHRRCSQRVHRLVTKHWNRWLRWVLTLAMNIRRRCMATEGRVVSFWPGHQRSFHCYKLQVLKNCWVDKGEKPPSEQRLSTRHRQGNRERGSTEIACIPSGLRWRTHICQASPRHTLSRD